MSARTVNHSTFVIERSFPAAPERVFGWRQLFDQMAREVAQ